MTERTSYRRIPLLVCLALGMFAASAGGAYLGAAAAASDDPSRSTAAAAFIRQGVNRVLAVLKEDDTTHSEKLSSLREVFRNYFDHRTMGRFAAGAYYRRASDEEREAYLSALEDFLLAVYGERMLRYSSEIDLELDADDIFAMQGTERASNGDIVVQTHINRVGADRITIDWRLRPDGDGFKIVDVVILNMSQLLVYRQEFSSVMRRSGAGLPGLTEVLNHRRRTIVAED